jgi:putative acyl-CoA dehydrogenase
VATIIAMVSATRLDCVIGSAAGIRAATVAAVHHGTHRQAFGKELAAWPLMANVLADLTLESQAATALAVRLAGAADRAARGDAAEAALLRLALPAAKYWVCKRFPAHAAEALECLGGNGYVEESGLPRIYREAPLNSIWEGSGNVTSLDVLRALAKAEGAADVLLAELDAAAGADAALDGAVAGLKAQVAGLKGATGLEAQHEARLLAGRIAATFAAALLVRHAPAAVADGYCTSRLGAQVPGGPAAPFGTLPAGLDLAAIIDRARAGPAGGGR